MKSYVTKLNMAIVLGVATIVAMALLLASSIIQRKYETKLLQTPTAELSEGESRSSEWSKAFPH